MLHCENCHCEFTERIQINFNQNQVSNDFKTKLSDMLCQHFCTDCALIKMDIDMHMKTITETKITIEELKLSLKFHRKSLRDDENIVN